MPKKLPEHIEEAIDTIDAAFFIGDTFMSKSNLKAIAFWLDRWERRIADSRELIDTFKYKKKK
jgi:hypothetical protein